MDSSATPIASMRGISRHFGDLVAVNNLDLSIAPGEVVGLLGPNGAGKSTAVRMLVGLLAPTEGTVSIAGVRVDQDPIAAKSNIGFVPDGAPLYPNLSPNQLLRLVTGLFQVPEKVARERSQHLLKHFELLERADDPVGQFSRGMRQKAALACALVHHPKLLILDEPLSGLDAPSASLIKEVLRGWADEGGAVLYTSHLLDVVERVCDRMVIIDKGHVVGQGSLDTLREQAGSSGTLEQVFLKLSHSDDPAQRAKQLLGDLRS
ncbi:MAG: ABC transporter ATP-binding protein [bacterium]|nr:ABC transporter ATP-binding protein [bacterium]